jgi:hypothetical protein
LNGIASYPNPAKDSFTILSENKNIAIFDILGNKITDMYPNN